jgi:hypothetical protein
VQLSSSSGERRIGIFIFTTLNIVAGHHTKTDTTRPRRRSEQPHAEVRLSTATKRLKRGQDEIHGSRNIDGRSRRESVIIRNKVTKREAGRRTILIVCELGCFLCPHRAFLGGPGHLHDARHSCAFGRSQAESSSLMRFDM